MKLIVLGAGAGGGFPQWNVASPNNRKAFAQDPSCPAATQCSLAASVNGDDWIVLNASPDLRQQIIATPELHPAHAPRSSPIKAVILAGADIDAIAGLLTLRERQPLTVWATDYVLNVIRSNPVFNVLNRELVHFRSISLEHTFEPLPGLTCVAVSTPGKPPLYLEAVDGTDPVEGSSIGLKMTSPGAKTAVFMPACAGITLDIMMALEGTDALFFDGTLCVDDEMVRTGEGAKTGRRMGHVSMDHAISHLRDVKAKRRYFIHINNTNPVLNRESDERKIIEKAGWKIAEDGMRIDL
ncbi:MAG: pyrroloquinoline quinone biosynthesis protein PqqB [Micropepsaceae bacterium]